jgi:methyl-accepting chemotaxis protein
MSLRNVKLSIRGQLYGSSLVTGLMLALLVGVAAYQLRRLSLETTQLSSETRLLMSLYTATEKAAAVMALPRDAAGGRGGGLNSYEVRRDDLKRDLVALEAATSGGSKKGVAGALDALQRADAEARQLFAHLAAGKADDASVQALILEEISSELLGGLRKVSLDMRQSLGSRLEGVESRVRAPLRSLAVTGLVVLALSVVVSVFIVRSIKPLAVTARGLAAAADELTAVAEGLGGRANEAADRARALAAASDEIRSHIAELATAAQGINAGIGEIGRTSQSAAEVAVGAVQTSEGTSATMSELQASGHEIGSVVKTISSLALQTNLLALNAAIEAARAGHAGAGFAVVAGEVKALAGSTAEATAGIAEGVATIQANTHAAVASLADVCQVIHQIRGSQASIAAAVQQQTDATLQVSERLASSARVIEEIAQDVGAVAAAAEATSANAGETRRLADGLSETAGELHSLVAAFRC